MARIYKMLARTADREDPDQTTSSEQGGKQCWFSTAGFSKDGIVFKVWYIEDLT